MNKTELKPGTVFLLFLLISFFPFKSVFSQSPKKDLFKIESERTINGEVNHRYDPAYLTGNFLFEDIILHQLNNYSVIVNGKETPHQDRPNQKDSLTKYLLTDLNLKQCVEFNLSETPTIIQSYPSSNKPIGLLGVQLGQHQITPEKEKDVTKLYFLEKDTLMNGYHYSIITDTTRFQDGNFIRTKQRLFINHDLADFQFHPFFQFLDSKYKGICTRVETFTNQYTAKIEVLFIKEISPEIQAKVEKYIEKYKSQTEVSK